MHDTETQEQTEELYLTPKQVAKLLQIHLETAREMLRLGKLPGKKINQEWRTRRSDLDEWMDGRDNLR